ncbi:MAG: DNA polymerase I [Aestuariivirga sp.]
MPKSAKLKPGDHLYLIDGSGYIFRAYHALPPLTRKSDGLPVGAVQGFCNMLWKLLKETNAGEKPTHLAVIFDKSKKTFRNEFYPEYKAHRPEPPADLRPQFGLIRQATRAFNVPAIEQSNYEADDLIATYARQAVEAGATCRIVSSDKDLMQLVRKNVALYDTMKDKEIGQAEVLEKFGVSPEKVIDVQSITGDSVDNVPGVEGVGEKSAAPLIREAGSLDRILSTPEVVKSEFSRSLSELQNKINSIAGEEVKLGSATQLAKIAIEKLGIDCEKKDKKGNPSLDTAAVEELARSGNGFFTTVLRARELVKALSSVDTVVKQSDQARLSKRLVTLDDRVPVETPVEDFAVDQPRASDLIGFAKALEFTSFTRKVASDLEADAAAIDAVPVTFQYWPPEGAEIAPTGSDSVPDSPAKSKQAEMPTGAAAIEAAETQLKSIAIDHSAYEMVSGKAELDRWIAEAMEQGFVSVDTETDSLDAMQANLVGISLSVTPGRGCYIPLGHKSAGGGLFGGDNVEGQLPLGETIAKLKPLLEDPGILKIGQNLKYDLQIFARNGIALGPIDDTMLMSYAIESGENGHGMDELSEKHLGHKPIAFKDVAGSGKSAVTFDRVPLDRATQYAAEDADITLRLWKLLGPRLAQKRKVTVYETLERPMVAVLAAMEREGILVDPDVLKKLSNDFAAAGAEIEKDIHKLAGEPFNVGSPKQLGDILFGKMALPGGRKTATGAWSTDSDALEDLANQGIELARKVVDWRQLSKLRSTYTDALPGFINPQTGRVHTSYALASTSTGRLSSTDPNLQNIPVRTEEGRKIRTAFIAPKGSKLISADYSQIELRVLAHVADIPQLKKAFADGLDIHAMTASEMFGVPVKGMDPLVRRRAKAINFGIIYGISAFGLANQLSISREEAGQYIKTYFQRFPGIREYMDKTKKEARENGYVETIFGRRCHFPRITSSNPSERAFMERASINAPIQGAAADIIRRAMIRMHKALADAGLSAKMLLQVHDELIFEAKDAEVDATMTTAKRVMEKAPETAVSLTVRLQVDARAAQNWEEAH